MAAAQVGILEYINNFGVNMNIMSIDIEMLLHLLREST